MPMLPHARRPTCVCNASTETELSRSSAFKRQSTFDYVRLAKDHNGSWSWAVYAGKLTDTKFPYR
jgi:hypothetical protein